MQPQNVIAIIWDFDGTLIPGSMQDAVLNHYGIRSADFWGEVNGLPSYYKERGVEVVPDTCHINHLLTYVQAGKLPGLNNRRLSELGKELVFYPGLPEFFPTVTERIEKNPAYGQLEIRVEHYIISSGIREMILGSAIAPYVKHVWGCQFIETPAPPGYAPDLKLSMVPSGARPRRGRKSMANRRLDEDLVITQIGYPIDSRSKNNILFDINKGANVYPDEVDVNAYMPQEERRVPFANMVYVADGPSDTSCFSVVKQFGGKTFAVYAKDSRDQLKQAMMLQDVGRADCIGPADYQEGQQAFLWILETAVDIAERIVADKRRSLHATVVPPARHIVQSEGQAAVGGPPETASGSGA